MLNAKITKISKCFVKLFLKNKSSMV